MNRRSFLSSLLKGAITATILPSAFTYERKWKVIESGLAVPYYTDRFHLLPFYLTKTEVITGVEAFKAWEQLLIGGINWQPNIGNTIRFIKPL